MIRESNPHRKARLVLSGLLLFVVSLQTSVMNAMAQTTTTDSNGFLSRLVAKRTLNLKASFTYGPGFPTEGQSVQFVDASTGSPTSWQWDFGDGSTSTDKNPTHKYLTSGFRKVTLVATGSAGSKKAIKTIAIMPAPATASFVFSPVVPTVGQTVQFADTSSGDPTSWQWDFGDGSTSTTKNPSHTYTRASSYFVTLISSSNFGSKRGSETITVASASSLSASFTYTPASPVVGQTVQFTDTSAGAPTSWQWNFGDGTSSTVQNPGHSYATAGSYSVSLTVTNSSESKSTSRTVTVVPSASLEASFTYSPASPTSGQAVQFTDTSSGSPTAWQWNFGDGTSSTTWNPSHTFTMAGSFNVALTATNNTGSKSVTRTITVVPPLSASFSFSPTTPVAGQAVQFTDTSTGSPTSWQWNFNDGSISTTRNPSHIFTSAGSYNVSLTVANSTGSKSYSRVITVQAASTLTADFTYAPSSPILGQTVQFTDTSTGSPTSWLWNFGNGVTSTTRNPSYTYTVTGPYAVTLTITAGSNSNSTSQTISVGYAQVITAASPSYADVSAAVTQASSGDTVIVPSGSATWASQLVITKGIILKVTTPGGTTIKSNYSAPHLGNPNEDGNYLIVYRPSNPAAKELFRLSGFVFDMANKCLGLKLGNSSTTAVDQLRIDNNKFSNSAGRAIFITGTVYGVIDSNEFTGRGAIIGVHGLASTSWNNLTFDFGTADNIYIEDNVFNITNTAHDGGVGGRYCVRHNTYNFTNASAGLYPFCDMHGNDPVASPSGMGVEIYENIINILSPRMGMTIFDHRGGKALLYNNNVITTGSVTTKCQEEHPDSDNPPASSPISGQPQHVSDSYYWGNRKNGTTPVYAYISQTVDYGLLKGLVPQENREFWDENPSFDGTTGIGIGLLANRPITCTKGVGYCATDTKTLYRCTATNTWEVYYILYAYPHPLRRLP